MADFAEIIKKHAGEDGNIPAAAIQTIVTAISNAVGNEYVAKERYKEKLNEIDELTGKLQTAEDGVDLNDKGEITDAKKRMESIKEEWADFIETTEVQGAETPNPINNTGDHMMSIEDIDKITDTAARQTAMAQNLGLFGIK